MSTQEVNATPAAIELAQVNNVDIDDVEGTGTDGKVTVDDVRGYIEDSGDEVTPVDQTRIDELRDEATGGATTGVIGGPTPSENMTAEQLPGDVDVEDLDDTEHEGEHPPLILAGYWVKLGVHESVEDEFVGAIASVVESPWTNVPFAGDTEETITGYRFDEDKDFLVKLRGSNEAIFEVPAEAIAASAQDRPTLLAYA
ncbi:MAG: hypothetical protein EHM23_25425 [Acidobacteria bacterium]|nr:MAG: hypothetical protein EHM23_25425 [Acidobacteriota bacterium]